MSEAKLAEIKPTDQTAMIDLTNVAAANGVAHACAPAAESPLQRLFPLSLFTARATASYRWAPHFRVGGDAIGRLFDEGQLDNEALILCRPADPEHGVMPGRLNAFFAISVNSPSMSMVNFCCCVCSAPDPCARGVTRRVTPQPMRAAVRMEAGAHACV